MSQIPDMIISSQISRPDSEQELEDEEEEEEEEERATLRGDFLTAQPIGSVLACSEHSVQCTLSLLNLLLQPLLHALV